MRRRLRYRFAQTVISAFAHFVFGYEAKGRENVPSTGAFLLAANHKSYFDPPFLGCGISRELRYFAKRQLFRIPIFASVIRTFGAIPVDREGADRRAIATALTLLERGEGLLVFPEGTRIRRPGLAEAKAGIGLLAIRSGAPVIPAYIASSWDPARTFFRRIPVRIRCGPPLRFPPVLSGENARARYEEATQSIMAAIARLAPVDADPAEGEALKKPH